MRGALLAALLLCAGCKDEADFDERYAEQQQKLEDEAAEIDQELQRRMTERPGSEDGAGQTPAPDPS